VRAMSDNTISKQMKMPFIGAQHSRSKIKQARNNNYTFQNCLNELIDYPILKATNIEISTTINDNKLYKLSIADDCEGGFINLLSEGGNNPFNFGHEMEDHDNDESISEFGTGMKQSAVSTGNKLTVYTKVDNICYKIVFEFPVMIKTIEVHESYNPTEFEEISKKIYRKYHRFNTGSTLIIEEILPDVLSYSSISNLDKELQESIQKTYSKILLGRKDKLKLVLNNQMIEGLESVYLKKNCLPFTTILKFLVKKGLDDKPVFLEHNIIDTKYRKLKPDTRKYCQIKGSELKDILELENYFTTGHMDKDGTMAIITGTGTQFLDEMSNKDPKLPKGELLIYKLDRYHGSIPDDASNGAKNYVSMEMKYKSKELGKLFGSNYNKTINFRTDNEFTKAVNQLKNELAGSLAYDTSTKKAWKTYEKAIELGINVHNSKIPEKYKKKFVEEPQESDDSKYDEIVDAQILNTQRDTAENLPVVVGGIVAWQAEEEDEEEDEESDVVEEEDEESDVAEEEDEESDVAEEEDEESDVVEEKCDDVSNIEFIINDPKKKIIGEGIQTTQTKKDIEIILNDKIPNKMSEHTGNDLKNFRYEICKCLEDMCMEKLNRQSGKFNHHYEMANNCGYEFMRSQYYKLIENRHNNDEVVGGSILNRFVELFLSK
jgi:hypothetical protein